MRFARTFAAVAILTCALSSGPVQAEEESPDTLQSEPESVSAGVDVSAAPPAKKSATGIEYRNGGVGKEERDALHLVTKHYPLKVVLAATGDRAFVSDAQIRILDTSGKAVFEGDGLGPLFFADLPAGKYTVAATAYGETKQQSVDVTKGKQAAVSFGW